MTPLSTPQATAAWISGQSQDLDVHQKPPNGRLYVGPLSHHREADFVLDAAKTCRALRITDPLLELTALVSLSRCVADYRKAVTEKTSANDSWQRAAARLDHQDPAHEDHRIRYVAACQAFAGADAALAVAERTLAVARGELAS